MGNKQSPFLLQIKRSRNRGTFATLLASTIWPGARGFGWNREVCQGCRLAYGLLPQISEQQNSGLHRSSKEAPSLPCCWAAQAERQRDCPQSASPIERIPKP
jgi:hypothetical protein